MVCSSVNGGKLLKKLKGKKELGFKLEDKLRNHDEQLGNLGWVIDSQCLK